jgi:hypothetical protein
MFKFKKIASVLASTAMLTSTVALAAAANYPAPFVSGGAADVAIVYGSHSAATVDLVGVLNIQDSLNSYLTSSTGTGSTGGTVTGGDYVLIGKSSDNLNMGNTWGVFTGSVDEDDLTTLLADGTYIADDNDEFPYEQKITLGTPNFTHFRDSDYEDLAGLSDRTPTLGFKIPSNTHIMNYTVDFTTDAESDLVGSDLDDIEGSDITILGKTYYVSNMDEQTGNIFIGKTTLLDSATRGSVNEGETTTTTLGDKNYEVTVSFIDNDEVVLLVNGERAPASGKLQKGESYKLKGGTYIGIIDISRLEVSGESGSATYSLGSGKLEITSDAEVKLNDDTIEGVKGYIYGTNSNTSTTNKIDKIEIEWISSDELFLAPGYDLTLPGFGAVKFSQNKFVRNEEEKISLENDGDTSIEVSIPIKDGKVSFNLLFGNASGEIMGLGKASDDQLVTAEPNATSLIYIERLNSNNFHTKMIASYNISGEAESALVRFKPKYDSTNSRNETAIQKNIDGTWTDVCTDKIAGDTCDVTSLISLTIDAVNVTGANENRTVKITGGTNVNFQTIYSAGGLRFYLPYVTVNGTGGNKPGLVNASSIQGIDADNINASGPFELGATGDGGITLAESPAGQGAQSWDLVAFEEDKDDNIAAGRQFNISRIDDNTDGNLQVAQIDGSGTGGPQGLEVGSGTSIYEWYVTSDVATRILHYTKPDEDYAEIYYPMGDSESYAEVFLTEVGAEISGGGSGGGSSKTVGVPILDTEINSASGKNIIVVGGSCVNKVAADLLGSSTPLCGADWESKTGVGSGSYLIETFERTGSKVATLVAGYNAGDTQNAAKALTTQTIDTAAKMKYTGTTSTSITSVVA